MMAVAMCFTSGIILGAGALHMLPDAADTWAEYFDKAGVSNENVRNYPWSLLLAMLTVLILMAIDFWVVRSGLQDKVFAAQAADAAASALAPEPAAAATAVSSPAVVVQPSTAASPTTQENAPLTTPASPGAAGAPAALELTVTTPLSAAAPAACNDEGHGHAHANGNGHGHSHGDSHGHSHSHSDVNALEGMRGGAANNANAWLFFLALSIHSLFDGLGLGAVTTTADFIALVAAVVSHEILDGFSVGVPIFMAKWRMRRAACAFATVGIAAPIGISIGLIASESLEGASALLARAIIISISGGSFLFLSLVEMIPPSFAGHGHGHSHGPAPAADPSKKESPYMPLIKFSAVLLGFTSMVSSTVSL